MQDMKLSAERHAAARPSWRRQLAEAVRDPDELCDLLGLPAAVRESARRGSRQFPLLATRSYLRRIRPGDPDDPLLRQVLPIEAETSAVPGFCLDAVGDTAARAAPGLLRKYSGRALLLVTGVCAVHCRYCFRRHFAWEDSPVGLERWQPAIREIAEDPSIEEVILSGGDPLALTDEFLAALVEQVDRIGHVTRLRVHSRLPIVIPDRVTDSLLRWLTDGRLRPIVVIHANHPRELDDEVALALDRLARAGVLLLNQAVLLRGVNDDAGVLADLSRRLIACRVVPYYLHQLDRVTGSAHFEVSLVRGRELVGRLQTMLPGYLVPRYVLEIAGEPSKTWLLPELPARLGWPVTG